MKRRDEGDSHRHGCYSPGTQPVARTTIRCSKSMIDSMDAVGGPEEDSPISPRLLEGRQATRRAPSWDEDGQEEPEGLQGLPLHELLLYHAPLRSCNSVSE